MGNEHVNFVSQPNLDQETATQFPKKRSTKRSCFFSCLLLLILFIGGCSLYKAIPSNTAPNDPDAYDPVTLEPKAPEGLVQRLTHFVFHKEKTLAGERNDRINILLMGMGGIGHDGPYLTDTIIIASIKPSTGDVAMISIPRDLGVDIPGHGWRKINNANAYGEVDRPGWGGAFATEIVEETFNIDIQYYIRIDFQAFTELIDEVGGLTINVDRAFTDPLFPAPNNEYQTIRFAAGQQTMNGETALMYARSRHGNNGEGSDFARAARQQKVILALKEKILSFKTLTNPVRINNLMEALDAHVTTNLEFSDIIELVKLAKELDTTNIRKLVLDTSPQGYLQNGYRPDGAFILEPKNGSFDEINQIIENIFESELVVPDDTPAQQQPTYSPAIIEVQNGTWRAGMASRMKAVLDGQGLEVTTVGNTQERPMEKSAVYAISDNAPIDVLEGISTVLTIPILESPPTGTVVAESTDILVILGDDFKE